MSTEENSQMCEYLIRLWKHKILVKFVFSKVLHYHESETEIRYYIFRINPETTLHSVNMILVINTRKVIGEYIYQWKRYPRGYEIIFSDWLMIYFLVGLEPNNKTIKDLPLVSWES